MHWITILGIIFVSAGTFLTILGQSIDNKKSLDLLTYQNNELIVENENLQKDVTVIKQINEKLEKRIKPLSGVLIPDNKPNPDEVNKHSIPTDAITLLFGNSLSYTNFFPHTVIAVGNDPLLVINKQQDILTISAKFFSEDGKIVAELKENQFHINPSNYFRLEKPDNHSLVIIDQRGNESLNIQFINSKVIKLTGRFYLPNHPPIIITDEYQLLGNNMKMSNCAFGQNKIDIHLR